MSRAETDRTFVSGWAAVVLVLAGLALARADGRAENNFDPDRAQTAALYELLQEAGQYGTPYGGQYGDLPADLPVKRVAEYLFGHGRTGDWENRQRMAWLHKVIDSLESNKKKS